MTYASLFFPANAADGAVAAALTESFAALGYTPFNPFGSIPGKSYPLAVRLFIAPAQAGWTRVLGEPDTAAFPALSHAAPFLYARLDGETGAIQAWRGGESQPVEAVFNLSVRAGQAPPLQTPVSSDPLLDALPESVRAMNTNPKQAQKMIERFSGGLLAKAGGAGQHDAALRLISGGEQWNSAAGQEIASVCASLAVPNWREPDFNTLRDAYQLHKRRRRNPKATLLPGDAETLAAVPDALAYVPVYMGKN
jgi:hypothetical protein